MKAELDCTMRPSDFLDRHVHLVGVGGAGMSALARLLHARGAEVSGSDAIPGPILEDLRRLGPHHRVGDAGHQLSRSVISAGFQNPGNGSSAEPVP